MLQYASVVEEVEHGVIAYILTASACRYADVVAIAIVAQCLVDPVDIGIEVGIGIVAECSSSFCE